MTLVEIMKKTISIILFILTTLNVSCQEKISESTRQKESPEKELKVLESLFVKADNGLNYRDAPKGNILGKLPYNEKVDIVEYTGLKEEIKDGENIVKGEWVKIIRNDSLFYIYSGFLEFNLDVSDMVELNEYHIPTDSLYNGYVSIVDDTVFIEKKSLKDVLTIECITKKEFRDKSAKPYYNKKDTSHINKKDSILTVSCFNNKFKKFIDNDGRNDDWDITTHYFVGRIDTFNLSVIYSQGYEWGSYDLIDETTCNLMKNFNGLPYFSKDFAKIVCLDTENHDETTIQIYDFTKKIKSTMNIGLDYLIETYGNSDSVYFDSQGNIYLRASMSWHDGITPKESHQHFKLTFK